jgi:sterol 14-demethylase
MLALILLGYEYELVGDSGKFPESVPQPDRNDIHMVSCLVPAPTGYSSDHST